MRRAERLISTGSEKYGWIQAAQAALELAHGSAPAISGDGFPIIQAALSTADFPEIVESTVQGISEARRSEQLSDILAVTRDTVLANYRATSFAMVDMREMPTPSVDGMNRFHFATVSSTGEEIRVFSTFVKFLVTRQILTGDDRSFVPAAINAFAAAAHRNEVPKIAALLESTVNLSDGAPLFGSDNALTGTALDAAGMGAAFGKLRQQPTETGAKSGAQPFAVVVHPDDEYAALALAENLPQGRRPRVVVLPDLSDSDDYFVIGAPATHPVINRSRLDGSDVSCLRFGAFEPASRLIENGKVESYPGLALPATHSVGLSVVSRVGAVRVSKS